MPSARQSSKIAMFFLLVAVMGFMTPAAAQQEVQIMVNGPWAYAPGSSSSTIFIVAPMSAGHGPVVIFPGEYAEKYLDAVSGAINGTQRITLTGQYALTISNLTSCVRTKPLPDEIPQRAYPLPNVGLTSVQQAVNKGFSISLPAPCYATTMADNYSRIDTNSPPSKEGSYTDWMVLHYWVNGSAQKITIGGQDVTFQNDFGNVPAVSIAMGPVDGAASDFKCDSLSVGSFLDEALLFGQNQLHVHFPRLLPPNPGTQTHNYIVGCADKRQTPAFFGQLLADIDTVQFYLSNQRPEKKESATTAFSRTEAAFCELAQVPKRVPDNVLEELKAVAAKLEFKAQCPTIPSEPSRNQIGPQLTGAKAYIERSKTAAGAGDCRGAQLNIDGTLQ